MADDMGDRCVGQPAKHREQHQALVHRWAMPVTQPDTGQNSERQEFQRRAMKAGLEPSGPDGRRTMSPLRSKPRRASSMRVK